METGAARTISFQTICGLAVCNHETEQRNEKTGHNYAAGHLRSFKIEIRDTSRQLRRIKRKGGGLQNERRTSRGLWRCFDEIFEKFVCVSRINATWRIPGEIQLCSRMHARASPSPSCRTLISWPWKNLLPLEFCSYFHNALRETRCLPSRLAQPRPEIALQMTRKMHQIPSDRKTPFQLPKRTRLTYPIYRSHYTYIRGMYVSHISFPFNPFGLTIIWINSRREL